MISIELDERLSKLFAIIFYSQDSPEALASLPLILLYTKKIYYKGEEKIIVFFPFNDNSLSLTLLEPRIICQPGQETCMNCFAFPSKLYVAASRQFVDMMFQTFSDRLEKICRLGQT